MQQPAPIDERRPGNCSVYRCRLIYRSIIVFRAGEPGLFDEPCLKKGSYPDFLSSLFRRLTIVISIRRYNNKRFTLATN